MDTEKINGKTIIVDVITDYTEACSVCGVSGYLCRYYVMKEDRKVIQME